LLTKEKPKNCQHKNSVYHKKYLRLSSRQGVDCLTTEIALRHNEVQ